MAKSMPIYGCMNIECVCVSVRMNLHLLDSFGRAHNSLRKYHYSIVIVRSCWEPLYIHPCPKALLQVLETAPSNVFVPGRSEREKPFIKTAIDQKYSFYVELHSLRAIYKARNLEVALESRSSGWQRSGPIEQLSMIHATIVGSLTLCMPQPLWPIETCPPNNVSEHFPRANEPHGWNHCIRENIVINFGPVYQMPWCTSNACPANKRKEENEERGRRRMSICTDRYKSPWAIVDGYDVCYIVLFQLLMIFRIAIIANIQSGQDLNVIAH